MEKYIAVFLMTTLSGCSTGHESAITHCATPSGCNTAAEIMARGDTVKKGDGTMISEIYALKSPEGFEQIDVRDIVQKYIPLGVDKTVVIADLERMNVPEVHEKPGNLIYAEARTGQALLTPNARRIVMEFFFDEKNKLLRLNATYLKLQ